MNAEDRLLAIIRQLEDSRTEAALIVLAFVRNGGEHFRLLAFIEAVVLHASEILSRFTVVR